MVLIVQVGADQNRPHPHRMRDSQVARVILEHRAGAGGQAVQCKHRLERGLLGFGNKPGMFNAVNRVKHLSQAAPAQHIMGIGTAAVGEHDPPAGQCGNGLGQCRIGGQTGKVDGMHVGQKGAGIKPVFGHQSGQCRAILPPVMVAQPISLGPGNAQCFDHIIGHPDLDLVKKTRVQRVQRVVQVKDPGADMGKSGFHLETLVGGTGRRNQFGLPVCVARG